jgi:hypothetical protein
MANNIELAKKYLPLLDEVYSASAKTAILDAPAELVREGASAKQILIPSVALEGLADYSRSTGFETGDVDFSWEPHEFSQDRGRAFIIDAQDNAETLDVALVATTGQFIRTKVVPEVDAYRIAVMATEAINAGNFADADLDKDTALQAIDAGLESMMEKEVDLENVVIFVSPKVHTLLKQSNLIVRQFDVQAGGAVNRMVETLDGRPVITVPQSRMYTEIDLTDNGFAKADGAFDVNFLIVDPQAVLGIKKTDLPRIFSPDVYQSANAWKFDYRLYHDLFVPANKVDGLYVHTESQGS